MKTFKHVFIALILLALVNGCVNATFEKTGADYKIERKAFLYPFQLEAIEVNPATGIITLLGYKSDGGTKTTAAIAEGVARGLK